MQTTKPLLWLPVSGARELGATGHSAAFSPEWGVENYLNREFERIEIEQRLNLKVRYI